MAELRDCLGRALMAGDKVVWPVRYADRIFLRSGMVVQVTEKFIRVVPDGRIKTWAYPTPGNTKGVFIHRTENVVLTP